MPFMITGNGLPPVERAEELLPKAENAKVVSLPTPAAWVEVVPGRQSPPAGKK